MGAGLAQSGGARQIENLPAGGCDLGHTGLSAGAHPLEPAGKTWGTHSRADIGAKRFEQYLPPLGVKRLAEVAQIGQVIASRAVEGGETRGVEGAICGGLQQRVKLIDFQQVGLQRVAHKGHAQFGYISAGEQRRMHRVEFLSRIVENKNPFRGVEHIGRIAIAGGEIEDAHIGETVVPFGDARV